MKAAKIIEQPSLAERIKAVRDEIEAAIDAKVDVVAVTAPGVPKPVLRNLILARAPGCLCRTYQQMEPEQQ